MFSDSDELKKPLQIVKGIIAYVRVMLSLLLFSGPNKSNTKTPFLSSIKPNKCVFFFFLELYSKNMIFID